MTSTTQSYSRKRKSLADHIRAEWHPTKNGSLSPDDLPSRSLQVVWWKCPKGDDHEWQTTPKNRTRGRGCQVCSGDLIVPSISLATLNPQLAEEWHPTKNGDVSPNDVASKSRKRVWWKCPKGEDHEWLSTVHNRANGSGCPMCVGYKVCRDNCLATVRPDLAEEWHPTRNGDLVPEKVLARTTRKLWWRCRFDPSHEWQATCANRTVNNSGCPQCDISKGERAIRDHLRKRDIFHRPEFRLAKCRNIIPLPFDFVIVPPGKEAGLIEFHGGQHYRAVDHFGGNEGFVKLKIRDQIKEDFCNEHKIPLLIIPHWDIDKVPALIDEFIESLGPCKRAKATA